MCQYAFRKCFEIIARADPAPTQDTTLKNSSKNEFNQIKINEVKAYRLLLYMDNKIRQMISKIRH